MSLFCEIFITCLDHSVFPSHLCCSGLFSPYLQISFPLPWVFFPLALKYFTFKINIEELLLPKSIPRGSCKGLSRQCFFLGHLPDLAFFYFSSWNQTRKHAIFKSPVKWETRIAKTQNSWILCKRLQRNGSIT